MVACQVKNPAPPKCVLSNHHFANRYTARLANPECEAVPGGSERRLPGRSGEENR
jgi:hypothetical protein